MAMCRFLSASKAVFRASVVWYLANLILVLTPHSLHAQVCTGDMTLKTQAEVDAFSCSEFTGNLRVDGSYSYPNPTDIVNLDGLSSLTSVDGDVSQTQFISPECSVAHHWLPMGTVRPKLWENHRTAEAWLTDG